MAETIHPRLACNPHDPIDHHSRDPAEIDLRLEPEGGRLYWRSESAEINVFARSRFGTIQLPDRESRSV